MKVPFVDLKSQYLSIKNEIDFAINKVIEECSFIGGKHVQEFEKNFAEKYGVKHCISVANGTDSLYIIMKMLNIGHGDEVITVSNSWISTSETISQTGATPVFVDIDPIYYTIDENQIEKKINKNTKAIIPVHIYGQSCDMEALISISNKYSIPIIEDCAQSHFSKFRNKLVGTFGLASSFSFYPGKNLGAYGDAGCILTNDDSFAIKCRMYSKHGALVKHQHKIEGINSRLDGLQAAVLNVKLNYIENWNKLRQKNAQIYFNELKEVESFIKIPVVRPNSEHTFHVFVINCLNRNDLEKHLNSNGIETAIHYPTPLPFLECYSRLNYTQNDIKNNFLIKDNILSLPMYPELSIEQIKYVAMNIKKFYLKH
jgi:dTDP-4-amino-4,6-dideoxygalactose transaminase